MKKALISPSEGPIKHIVSWDKVTPIYAYYPNSCRVAEVCGEEFEVSPPLFWVDCADDVVADEFYYDTSDEAIYPIVNEPYPS